MAKPSLNMVASFVLRSRSRHFSSLSASYRFRGNPRSSVLSSVSFPLSRSSSASAACFSYSSSHHSSFDLQPSPPRLPPEEQAEFERLLREASESINAASLADALAEANAAAAAAAAAEEATAETVAAAAPLKNGIDKLPAADSGTIEGVWRGAPPEFDGDRNPKTGEVGGPKNEPLRWGSDGDWSYNGRVTDF